MLQYQRRQSSLRRQQQSKDVLSDDCNAMACGNSVGTLSSSVVEAAAAAAGAHAADEDEDLIFAHENTSCSGCVSPMSTTSEDAVVDEFFSFSMSATSEAAVSQSFLPRQNGVATASQRPRPIQLAPLQISRSRNQNSIRVQSGLPLRMRRGLSSENLPSIHTPSPSDESSLEIASEFRRRMDEWQERRRNCDDNMLQKGHSLPQFPATVAMPANCTVVPVAGKRNVRELKLKL